MTADPISAPSGDSLSGRGLFSGGKIPLRDAVILTLLCVGVLAVRVPVMFRQPGGMDEDWFAVPGWTVAYEGIPRVPYAPERNRESYFWHADTMLFALPPAFHYWQAPWFRILPAGVGTGRFPSCVAGLLAIWLVYLIGRRLLEDRTAALFAAGLFSVSRIFYFPAITARPDMLCALLGLGMVYCLLRWERHRARGWIAAAGACLGLAGLTHPVAIVYALQGAGWIGLAAERVQRKLLDLTILTATALIVFSLWGVLIVQQPELFRVQFFGNVLSRSVAEPGSGLETASRVSSLGHQLGLLLEHAGPWQLLLMISGVIFTGVVAVSGSQEDRPKCRRLLALTVSSIVLLLAMQGGHPTKGYWVYPGAFCFLCVGDMAGAAWDWSRKRGGVLARGAVAMAFTAAMIPGSGIRTTVVTLQHWNEPEYNAPVFLQQVLRDYPADAVLIVDPAYVFDAHLAGRRSILGVTEPHYFHAQEHPWDYYLVSRYGLANGIPEELKSEPVARYGNQADPFACYLEVHRPREQPRHVE